MKIINPSIYTYCLITTTTVLLASTGCAGHEEKQAFEMEKLLVSAGFRYRVADTAEQKNCLATLPRRKLFRIEKDRTSVCVFADQLACNYFYDGDGAAYRRLRKLVRDDELEQWQHGRTDFKSLRKRRKSRKPRRSKDRAVAYLRYSKPRNAYGRIK